jgi:hypothetical protein
MSRDWEAFEDFSIHNFHFNFHFRPSRHTAHPGPQPRFFVDLLQHQISNNPENIQTHTEDLRRIQQTLTATHKP